MDRWVDIVMSARRPEIVTYFDDRARYGICFGLLYFLFGALAVDLVLQKYWPLTVELPDHRIVDLDHYVRVKTDQQRYALVISESQPHTNDLKASQQALSKCTSGTLDLPGRQLWSPDHTPLGFCY